MVDMNFIFSPWWQFIGSFLLTTILFFCFHQWNKSLDEELLEEEFPSYESNSWEFQIREVR